MRRLVILLVALGLYGAYEGVTALVRRHVDARIEESHDRPLPAFTLDLYAGGTFDSRSLSGKPAILHFTRSFCSNCVAEKDEIRRFVAGLDPNQVSFVSVMMDRVMGFPPEATARTIEQSGFRHPVLMADQAFVDAFHGTSWAKVTPIAYFVDASGVIRSSLRGQQTVETLAAGLAHVSG